MAHGKATWSVLLQYQVCAAATAFQIAPEEIIISHAFGLPPSPRGGFHGG
jgi:hypothetical protein